MNKVGSVFRNVYKTECFRNGAKVWEEVQHNLVVNEGLNDVLDKYFKGVAYTAQHYAGLKGVGAIAASDTLLDHPGWVEILSYSGARKVLTLGAVAAQSVDNSASKAQFDITADTTIAGVIVATVETGNVGVLFGAVDFSQNRPVLINDILIVTCTFTQGSM